MSKPSGISSIEDIKSALLAAAENLQSNSESFKSVRTPNLSRSNSLVTFDRAGNFSQLDFRLVLFLDFDGVLHPLGCRPHEEFCYVKNFVDAVRLVDPQHKTPIVISSLWRHNSGLVELRTQFPTDIASQIVGVTPFKTAHEVSQIADWSIYGGVESLQKHRQREISQWMHECAPDGNWLAIDDQPSYFHDNESRLFCVPGLGSGGITSSVAMDLVDWFRSRDIPVHMSRLPD